jgi:hypothetical protein
MVLTVAAWQVLATRARRPFQPFQLTAKDFATFAPETARWSLKAVPVQPDPTEPNILAFEVHPRESGAPGARPLFIRLVHGYNMCDCMRLKNHQVERVADFAEGWPRPAPAGAEPAGRTEVWRLTSSVGDRALWATSMLNSRDYSYSSAGTEDMAFPRITAPESSQDGVPQGITWNHLRNPLRSFRRYIELRWNAARSDLPTFLSLRQPAWANEEVLTFVSASRGPSVGGDEEGAVMAALLDAHHGLVKELRRWKAAPGGGP